MGVLAWIATGVLVNVVVGVPLGALVGRVLRTRTEGQSRPIGHDAVA